MMRTFVATWLVAAPCLGLDECHCSCERSVGRQSPRLHLARTADDCQKTHGDICSSDCSCVVLASTTHRVCTPVLTAHLSRSIRTSGTLSGRRPLQMVASARARARTVWAQCEGTQRPPLDTAASTETRCACAGGGRGRGRLSRRCRIVTGCRLKCLSTFQRVCTDAQCRQVAQRTRRCSPAFSGVVLPSHRTLRASLPSRMQSRALIGINFVMFIPHDDARAAL